MQDWTGRPNELVALALALLLGLGLVSVLLHVRALATGLSRRRAWLLLGQFWAAATLALVVLLATRIHLGHALVGGSPSTGWYATSLNPSQGAALAGAAVALLVCGLWIMRTVAQTGGRRARPTQVTVIPPGDEAP
ncbi:MAG: hypothetical protein HPY69_00480 [Armatimonadetes bacterium]|nr:hypothetical protein [Armatimonadota bacterium]